MKVLIIGGGIGGLTVAHELTKKGHQVIVYEKNDFLGGLTSGFATAGTSLEKFYHHIFTTDLYYQQMVKEVGLEDKLMWLNPKMGMFHGGKVYDFGTPKDLLRFKPLSFFDQARFGLSILYLQRVKNWHKYDSVTAASWLKKYAGPAVFRVIWEPLLKAKFGKHYDKVSMAWFWARVTTRAGSRRQGKETLGYVRGGFMALIDAMAAKIKGYGGEIVMPAQVDKILLKDGRAQGIVVNGREVTADAVVCTLAPSLLLKLLPDAPPEFVKNYPSVDYLGAMCLVLRMEKSITPIYWLNISDPDVPITSIVEHTNLIDKSNYQGNVYLYLGNYLPQDHRYFKMDSAALLKEFEPHLKKIFPSYSPSLVKEQWLFKEMFAQPVIETGYNSKIPPLKTSLPGLYHVSMAQVYPEDRGTNFSIKLGMALSKIILEDHAH